MNCEECPEPQVSPAKDAIEEDVEEMVDEIISYGFDPDVVNTWFKDKAYPWEDAQRKTDIQNAKQSQRDIREAADYLKNISDNWLSDISRQQGKEEVTEVVINDDLTGLVD